jgi:hypothetical protein
MLLLWNTLAVIGAFTVGFLLVAGLIYFIEAR